MRRPYFSFSIKSTIYNIYIKLIFIFVDIKIESKSLSFFTVSIEHLRFYLGINICTLSFHNQIVKKWVSVFLQKWQQPLRSFFFGSRTNVMVCSLITFYNE